MIDFRSNRLRLALAGIAIVALLVLLRSCDNKSVALPHAAEDVLQPVLLLPADIVQVSSGSIAGGVSITGTLQPLQQTSVNARVGGVIDEVLVRAGDNVRSGQVLIRQNTADLKAQLAQTEASLHSAEVEMKLSKAYQDRKKELYEKKYLSEVDWAAAQADTEARIAAFRVQQAALDIAKKSLADATLTAPLASVVATRNVEPGARVMPGQSLITLVNLSEMELAAEVPAREVPKIKIGDTVIFNVDGLSNREFRGHIVRINPVASTGSRTITIYVRIKNADGALRGGMFASGYIAAGGNRDNVLRIPAMAVQNKDSIDRVWLVRDGKLVLQPVTLGARDITSGLVEVKQGLAINEHVVLAKLGERKPGAPVTIEPVR